MSGIKALDMKSLQEFVEDSELLAKTNERKRSFEYNLSKKHAKSKLVKGGKRIPFDIVEHKTSSNLIFSVGAWDKIVLPAVKYWNAVKGDKTCTVGSMTVRIASVSVGMEAGKKHIDTLVVFYANMDKVVCHLYNTTQLILVNGHGYVNFINQFLKPFFESKVSMNLEEIEKYNSMVLEKLGCRRVKRSSVSYNKGSTFPCNTCDFATSTLMTLKKHMKHEHLAISLNSTKSSSSLLSFKHSTRNNSISESEALLQENLTITNISNESPSVTLEETALKFTCLECNFVTKEKNTMELHVQTFHGKSNFICKSCSHVFNEEEDYNSHVSMHDKQEKETTGASDTKIVTEKQKRNEINENHVESEENDENQVKTEENNERPEEENKKQVGSEENNKKMEEITECSGETDTVSEESMSHCIEMEKEKFQCDICITKFESNDSLENHMDSVHKQEISEYICIKCNYISKTEIGMKRHENVFCNICNICLTGNVDFDIHMMFHKSCQTKGCVFKATTKSNLRDHVILVHGRTVCELCREVCESEIALQQHIKVHEKKDHEEVIKDSQTVNDSFENEKNPTSKLECDVCEFKGLTKEDMECHAKLKHMNIRVDIKPEEQITLQCNQCDFECKLNIQLKKHTEKKHKEARVQLKYACNSCGFGSNFVAELWNHVIDAHPGENQFESKAKHEIFYNLVAEQNVNILEEFNTLKDALKKLMKHLLTLRMNLRIKLKM